MRRRLLLQLLLLLLLPLLVHLRLEVEVPLEVITNTTSCSTTCGVGIKTETLCVVEDAKTALERNAKTHEAAKVSTKCRVQKVKCMESWQCGLTTMTATVGQRVVINCVEEVMNTMGKFSWRVSWRFARGVITSDNTLFAPWEAPELDRITLDPVREQNAGTYRCDVKNTAFRRVKREYWGVRVLPIGILNLDYESSEARWDQDLFQQNKTVSLFPHAIGISVTFAAVLTGLVGFCMMKRRKKR